MSKPVEVTVLVPQEFSVVIEMLAQSAWEIDDLESLEVLEAVTDAKNKIINQAIMQAAYSLKARQMRENDIRTLKCLQCDGWADLLDEAAPRYALTVAGRVDFTRPIHRDGRRECQKQRSLFDEGIGLGPREHYTPLLKRKIAWMGATNTSYQLAANSLKEICGLSIEPKQIQRITEQSATVARRLQDKEVERLGRPATKEAPTLVDAKPETCVIEMDGTCVMGRDGEGHEVKCATVFGLEDRIVRDDEAGVRSQLLHRGYTSTSHGIKAFGALVWALAVSWGIRSAKRVVVIGDGADWIWKYSKDRLHFTGPDGREFKPIEILDYYHACENLGKARDLIFVHSDSPPAKKWYAHWSDRIRKGAVDELIVELKKRIDQCHSDKKSQPLSVRCRYFETHRTRMEYPRYEEMNLPIGSGAIEGTCKNLIKGRMSCVGQRWDGEEGIENMAALRTRIFNEKFADLWDREKTG